MKNLIIVLGCVLVVGCTAQAWHNFLNADPAELQKIADTFHAPADRYYQRQQVLSDVIDSYEQQRYQQQVLENQEQILRKIGPLKTYDPAYYDR